MRTKRIVKTAALATLLTVVAIVSAVVVPRIQEQARFRALQTEGKQIVLAWQDVVPDHIPPHAWREMIIVVHNTWGNVAFHPNWVDIPTMERSVARLRALSADATPGNITTKVLELFNLLEEIRPASHDFVRGMREMFLEGLAQFPESKKDLLKKGDKHLTAIPFPGFFRRLPEAIPVLRQSAAPIHAT